MNFAAVSLRDLEYVVAVADRGSFIAAAEQCGVSQPSLSAQVLKVEAWLKAPLFERTSRTVLVTDNGARFVAQARKVLDEARLLATVVEPEGVPFGGILRLSAIATLGPYFFPAVLAGLRKGYPDLSIKLSEGLTHMLVQSLLAGDLDAVLMTAPVDDRGLVSAPVFSEPFVLACPTGYALPGSAEEAWAALPAHERLLLEEGHCLRQQALAACADVGKSDRHATSLHTLKYMVAAGEGCTLIPALAVTEMDGVSYTPAGDKGFAREIVLVWRNSDGRSSQFSELAATLRDLIGDVALVSHSLTRNSFR